MREEFRSTSAMVETFIQSSVWLDIADELKEMIEEAQANMLSEKDMVELYRFQGRIDALTVCLGLPQVFKESLEHDEIQNVKKGDE